MKLFHKFSFKMVMYVLLLSIVPLLVTMVLSYVITKDVIKDKIYESNTSIIEGYKAAINERIDGASSSVKAAALSNGVVGMNATAIDHSLVDIVESNTAISQMYLMDTTGMQIYKTSGELGDRSDRDYFKTAMTGEANFSDVIISASTGIPIIVYAVPVYEDEAIVGVIGASFDLSFIKSLISVNNDPNGSYAFLVDQTGVVVAHPDNEVMDNRENLIELSPVAEVTAGKAGSSEYVFNDDTKLASYTPLEVTQWGLIYQQPTTVAFESITNILRLFLIITLITVAIVVVGAIRLSSSVNKPLKEIEAKMKMASEGKMNLQLDPKLLKRKDEFGYLAKDFRQMIEALRVLLLESVDLSDKVSGVADQLALTTDATRALSNEITNAVEEIAKGASEQAEESEKGVTITSNFTSKFSELTQRSNSMHSNVDTVIKVNEDGYKKVKFLEEASGQNVVTTSRVEASIKELNEKSASISGILETISSIAEQTNLLALNASIEAARAGEHGRGFAVVAEEIRKLAEGSKVSTDQIGSIIGSIQNEIAKTVDSMKEVTESSQSQSKSVIAVNEAFKRIDASITEISRNIREIDSSVVELNADNAQVVDAISTISAVSEETAAAAEEVTASVEQQYNAIEEVALESAELQGLALSLKKEIEKFEL